MRHLSSAALRAGLIAVVIGLPVPASAQSFLQNLFGWGTSSAPSDRSAGRTGGPAYGTPQRSDVPWNREMRRYSPAASEDMRNAASEDNGPPQPGSGSYRTLCVRTCDGYYFPIGNAVSRNRFMRDAAQCRASCGEEARLFYLPAGSDNVSTMLDLSGRSYVRMATAFKYRKSLTDGCTCRPMPWSAAEQQRHQKYAEEAARVAAAAGDVKLAAATASPVSADSPPSATVTAGDVQTTAADAASATDTAGVKPAMRGDRGRQSAVLRGAERAPPARRQHAAVRAPAPQASVSWFAPSSSKYTWPGDPPRR